MRSGRSTDSADTAEPRRDFAAMRARPRLVCAAWHFTHREFLSLDGRDPRRACAEALVALPDSGAVIAYSAGFEKGQLAELADAFPDLSGQLLDMASRTVDLRPVARAHWYHRDQRGSWSIKAVLPTVAPVLDYAALDVKDGMQAQAVYLEAITPDTTPERRAAIDAGLRIYCGRDTHMMMVLASHLGQDEAITALV
jgi:hypothetical protein